MRPFARTRLRAFALLRVPAASFVPVIFSPQRLPRLRAASALLRVLSPSSFPSLSGALARVSHFFALCGRNRSVWSFARTVFADRFFRHLGLCSVCFHASLSGALFLGFEITQPFRFYHQTGIFPSHGNRHEGGAQQFAVQLVLFGAPRLLVASRTEPELPR